MLVHVCIHTYEHSSVCTRGVKYPIVGCCVSAHTRLLARGAERDRQLLVIPSARGARGGKALRWRAPLGHLPSFFPRPATLVWVHINPGIIREFIYISGRIIFSSTPICTPRVNPQTVLMARGGVGAARLAVAHPVCTCKRVHVRIYRSPC